MLDDDVWVLEVIKMYPKIQRLVFLISALLLIFSSIHIFKIIFMIFISFADLVLFIIDTYCYRYREPIDFKNV